MKIISLALLLVLLMASFVFADVGPPPPEPNIKVIFLKDQDYYQGNISLSYVCTLAPGPGPTGEREVNFTCSKGVCTNDYWYYKFNPCYYPTRGRFAFTLDDGQKRFGPESGFTQGTWIVNISLDHLNLTDNKVPTNNSLPPDNRTFGNLSNLNLSDINESDIVIKKAPDDPLGFLKGCAPTFILLGTLFCTFWMKR
ncbi:hypothetical protein HY988_06645 [Candidatus Micrarchaeota archaeon]|nr:hypothetical protein [Candidatus Micrarchaeota archaeon]